MNEQLYAFFALQGAVASQPPKLKPMSGDALSVTVAPRRTTVLQLESARWVCVLQVSFCPEKTALIWPSPSPAVSSVSWVVAGGAFEVQPPSALLHSVESWYVVVPSSCWVCVSPWQRSAISPF